MKKLSKDQQQAAAAKVKLASFPKKSPEWLKAYNALKASRGNQIWQKPEVADLTISMVEKMSPGMGIQRLYERLKRILS